MARVFARERTWLDPLLRPVERLIYRLTRVNETHEMRWTEYGLTMLAFSLVSIYRCVVRHQHELVFPRCSWSPIQRSAR